jgi:exopolysaccharide production protein ExoQ
MRSTRVTSIQRVAFFVVFAVLFIAAEHMPPFSHARGEDWTAANLITVREGSTQRRVAYVVLAAVTALLALRSRPIRGLRMHRGGVVLCALFLTWAGASALWSDEPDVLIRRLMVLGIMLSWVYVCIRRWDGSTVVHFIVFSTVTSVAVSCLTDLFQSGFHPLDPEYRMSGTLLPNELGLTSMVLVIAALTAARNAHRWGRMFIVCAAGGGLILLLTKSRTSLIGLAVSTIVLVHLTVPTRKKLVVLWLLVCVAFGVTLYTGPDAASSAVSFIPRSQEEVSSLNGRLPMWQDCIEDYAMKRPILGFGYTTFWTADRITRISDAEGWGVAAAHSAYLEMLLDLGVPGVALYVTLLILSLLTIRRRMAHGKDPHLVFCASILCGLATIGLTESELPFRNSAIYFYSLLALLLPYAVARGNPEVQVAHPVGSTNRHRTGAIAKRQGLIR